MKSAVLVTGASGFLGRHLGAACATAGVPVFGLRRTAESRAPVASAATAPIRLVQGSVLEPEGWCEQPGLGEVGTIVHTAGVVVHSRRDADEMTQLNVEGTLQMVRTAHRLGARCVLVSTSGTVGCFRKHDLLADEHAPFAEATIGQWPYYASKVRAERDGRRLAEKLGVPFTVARLPVLLGPEDHARRSTSYVARLLESRLSFVPNGGMHFTDVRDVATALVTLAQQERMRGVYHFPGTHVPLAAFFRMVSEVSGQRVEPRHAPGPVLDGLATAAEHARRLSPVRLPTWMPDPVVLEMASHYWGLTTLWTGAELGYAPRLPRQTLADTVEWLRSPGVGARHAA